MLERITDIEHVDYNRCDGNHSGSTIAVVQVVQPRFEPPATTNLSTVSAFSDVLDTTEVTVSMALTADFVMGTSEATFHHRCVSICPRCKR